MNIVWFKKDLRIEDHGPLVSAMKNRNSIGLFVIEDKWLQSDEFDPCHLKFALECLRELKSSLKMIGVPLLVAKGDVCQVFEELRLKVGIEAVYSHRETGSWWTYDRDRAVKKYLKSAQIGWHEFDQFGVFRPLNSRDEWTSRRQALINSPIFVLDGRLESNFLKSPSNLDGINWIEVDSASEGQICGRSSEKTKAQIGGRIQAKLILNSFLTGRVDRYIKSISSPSLSFNGSSRLSPYITWGCLSIKEIHAEIGESRTQNLVPPYMQPQFLKNLKHFEDRLWWHCHFVQKLETEPKLEFQNQNIGFDGMREAAFDNERFLAWKEGRTGFPLVDASMRALKLHGWINFRMRAMLMSFASYQLWLHWRPTAQHLARQFVDFEPGIHFSQAQMQSGVTGINAIRIYSPVKQAQERDADGEFIKQYCPELAGLDGGDLFEPHKMSSMAQNMFDVKLGKDYPFPIVDPDVSYREAKERVFEWSSRQSVRKASREVFRKLGSRKHKNFPIQKRSQEPSVE